MDPLDLIGTPYDKEHDCYWLIRSVVKIGLGITLPEKPISWRRYGRTIDWPTDIEAFNLIFFSSNAPRTIDHVGIAVSNIEFLHSSEHHGSVVQEPIRRYGALIVAVGKFR